MSKRLWLILALAATAVAADSALVDRVGSTGFVQLEAESFRSLSARQQALGYWLSQAAIAIDPINYDQNSIYGLRQKRLLEEILLHPNGVDPQAFAKITAFTRLFWANRGNHNELTAQKFLPYFQSPLRDLELAPSQWALSSDCLPRPAPSAGSARTDRVASEALRGPTSRLSQPHLDPRSTGLPAVDGQAARVPKPDRPSVSRAVPAVGPLPWTGRNVSLPGLSTGHWSATQVYGLLPGPAACLPELWSGRLEDRGPRSVHRSEEHTSELQS